MGRHFDAPLNFHNKIIFLDKYVMLWLGIFRAGHPCAFYKPPLSILTGGFLFPHLEKVLLMSAILPEPAPNVSSSSSGPSRSGTRSSYKPSVSPPNIP